LGLLVDCLFGWFYLLIWLAGWLAGCLAGWLSGWLSGLLAGWLSDWLPVWLVLFVDWFSWLRKTFGMVYQSDCRVRTLNDTGKVRIP
jgi:hypothetical protein